MLQKERTARNVGAWCIVFGVVSATVGIAVGVGCFVAAGKLLSRF